MPRKGQKVSVEMKERISNKLKNYYKINKHPWKGKKLSEEHKKKLSDAHKGLLVGNKNPAKRKDVREKMSKALKGKKRTLEQNEKNRIAHLGQKQSKASNIKRSITLKGYKVSAETRMKIGLGHKRDKCYFWRGGISFEPYGLEFNEDLKEVIRNRDRRKCTICCKTELENNKRLCVHHINYNKKDNNPKNLISLCNKCHSKTNSNRKYWINYFKMYDKKK
jgi:hypothetical protein